MPQAPSIHCAWLQLSCGGETACPGRHLLQGSNNRSWDTKDAEACMTPCSRNCGFWCQPGPSKVNTLH